MELWLNITCRGATGLGSVLSVYMGYRFPKVYILKNSLCVCSFLCACMSVGPHIPLCRYRGQRTTLHLVEAGSLVYFCPPPIFQVISHLHLPSHNRNTGIIGLCYCTQVYTGHGDLNSGLGVCVASALFTKSTLAS